MLTDQQIENAKNKIKYENEANHTNNDSIRIAYAWFDAQIRTKAAKTACRDLKKWMEEWGGFYVSTSDVIVAAYLHPEIYGDFPYYNISKKFTEPSIMRLSEIPNAFKHDFRKNHRSDLYKHHEDKYLLVISKKRVK